MRRHRTEDGNVVGVTPPGDGPAALGLASRDSRGLRLVGTMLPLQGQTASRLGHELRAARNQGPIGRRRLDRSRFAGDRTTQMVDLGGVTVELDRHGAVNRLLRRGRG